ncbi:helix-turn-helix domain protein, partial [Neisseria meningitidis 96024]
MSYTQLTQGERYHIQYLSRHCTVTEIAKQLNRHKSTISREIRRHRTQGQQYSAEKAQRQSRTIKQRKRQPYKLDSQLIQHIDTLIRRKLSPEQVCAYLANTTRSRSTTAPFTAPSPRQKQRQHV